MRGARCQSHGPDAPVRSSFKSMPPLGDIGVSAPRPTNQAARSALRQQHAAKVAENLLRAEFAQAVQMTQRTLAGEARTAFQMQPLYLCKVGEGRRVAR